MVKRRTIRISEPLQDSIAIYLLRSEEQDAPDLGVPQQLFMHRFFRIKVNSAQGEALSKSGRKIAMMLTGQRLRL